MDTGFEGISRRHVGDLFLELTHLDETPPKVTQGKCQGEDYGLAWPK